MKLINKVDCISDNIQKWIQGNEFSNKKVILELLETKPVLKEFNQLNGREKNQLDILPFLIKWRKKTPSEITVDLEKERQRINLKKLDSKSRLRVLFQLEEVGLMDFSDIRSSGINLNLGNYFQDCKSKKESLYYLLLLFDEASTDGDKEKIKLVVSLIYGLVSSFLESYELPEAIIAMMGTSQVENNFQRQFIEFLNLNQDFDGSIGILNPRQKESMSPEQVKNWKVNNSIICLIYLLMIKTVLK